MKRLKEILSLPFKLFLFLTANLHESSHVLSAFVIGEPIYKFQLEWDSSWVYGHITVVTRQRMTVWDKIMYTWCALGPVIWFYPIMWLTFYLCPIWTVRELVALIQVFNMWYFAMSDAPAIYRTWKLGDPFPEKKQ